MGSDRSSDGRAALTRRRLFGGAAAIAAAASVDEARSAPAQGPLAGSSTPAEQAVIEPLLARMTLEEKLGQLTQARGELNDTGPYVPAGNEDQVRAGAIGSFLGVYGAEETRRLQTLAVEQSRLGVPLLFAFDVIHGFRTIFPVPLAEAATFDVEAVELSARIAAIEAAAHGVHWTFAPMVDIARDPRWGRVVEGSGEDPRLGAMMAAARVRGFQGDGARPETRLAATAKHFIAYGAAEGGRDYNTAEVSAQTLHETYLPPFRAAVDAGALTVMAAFNEVGGVPMHANRVLLQGVLRERCGFEGVVVSDYTGVRELMAHGIAADPEQAAKLALAAGVDIDMVSGLYLASLPGAVRGGRVSERAVDDAVRRVLRLKHRLGLFADPYRYCDAARQARSTLTPAHRRAAREVARTSMVLLKNEAGLLPLSKEIRTLAVIGPLADDRRSMIGSWIGAGRGEDAVGPLEGLRAAAPACRVLHAPGVSISGADVSGIAEAEALARQADMVVLCVGEHGDMTGEARSRSSLDLPGAQEELARRIHAVGKPVVVVLFTGRPLAIDWLAEHASSILLAWHPGVEAGPALADLLFGAYNPAGRLPITFPRSVGQVPIYYNHKNTGRPPAAEGNSSKYIDGPWEPLYVFGHGLSYTQFKYGPVSLSSKQIRSGDRLDVSFEVSNVGPRAGDEVVQLYIRDHVARITRPVLELRHFARIRLEPGERRTVRFALDSADLSFVGPDLEPVVEPGRFSVYVGGDSTHLVSADFLLTA